MSNIEQTTNFLIEEVAALFVEKHGEDALIEAAIIQDSYAISGNATRSKMWSQISLVIERLILPYRLPQELFH